METLCRLQAANFCRGLFQQPKKAVRGFPDGFSDLELLIQNSFPAFRLSLGPVIGHNHPAVRLRTGGISGHTGHLLQGSVDHMALVSVHRLQGNAAAVLDYLSRHLPGQMLEALLPLEAVVLGVPVGPDCASNWTRTRPPPLRLTQ